MSLLLDAIHTHAVSTSDRVALSDARRSMTYSALEVEIERTIQTLRGILPATGPIALCADNSIAWILIDLAFVRMKRSLIPIPLFFTPDQREHALVQSAACGLIIDKPGQDDILIDVGGTALALRKLVSGAERLPPGTSKVTYTSGTTGQPKGVCLSQSGMEAVSASLVKMIGAEYAGCHLAVLPLAVLLENVAGLYTTLIAGGHYLVLPQAQIGFGRSFVPDYGALLRALVASAATSIILVPEILRGLMRAMISARIGLPAMKLIAVGGARVSPDLLDQAARLGLPVYQGYGLSEAASVVTLNTPRENRPGSAGKVLPHAGLQIDQNGEVHVTTPAFVGYVGAGSTGTAYATGDVGRIDADGFLFIEGRSSNVIITSFGRNVSPEWVESELLSQAAIGQAFAFGDAHPSLGALIVPSAAGVSDAEITAAIAAANAALPEYAHVKHWAKVFPFTPANQQLTPNGRMRRAAIGVHYADLMTKVMEGTGKFTPFFERLVRETESDRAYLMATPQIRDGLNGQISLETYRLYLAEAYHHVKHTVPLFEKLRACLPASKAWLRDAAEEYIAEETGHEEWVLDDIRAAGGDSEAVRHSQPGAATEFMVAYAYDYIARVNPVGFFGMVFVLEGTSTQLATRGADALMKSLSLPAECFRYLTSHGALDLSHMQFFQGLMDRLTDADDQAAVIHMARRMFVLFANLFRSIPHDQVMQNAA